MVNCKIIRNSKGVFHIPLLLLMIALLSSSFGFWMLLSVWHKQVETQLRLNRCVGLAAREFRDSLQSIESANQQMKMIRAAIVAASGDPPLLPPLRIALQALVLKQEGTQLKWRLKTVEWLASRGCREYRGHRRHIGHSAFGRGDLVMPLPDLNYSPRKTDTIGSLPLEWQGEMPTRFNFEISHLPRAAAAEVKGQSKHEWTASWSIPNKLTKTDFSSRSNFN